MSKLTAVKYLVPIIILSVLLACNKPEIITLREQIYAMYPANMNPTSGEVIFTELAPGKLQVEISLSNTTPGIEHTAHLHFGSISEVGDLAMLLNPVDGDTGKSITILDQQKLSSGQVLTFELLSQMNGSVKVHMDDTYFKNYVLAFGNIGRNDDYTFVGPAVCN